MKKIFAVIVTTLLLSGCSFVQQLQEPKSDTAYGFADLVEDFRSEELKIGNTETLNDVIFLNVSAKSLEVGKETIQIYQFKSIDEAVQAKSTVSLDGKQVTNSLGVSMIDWTAPPHFYQKGKLIVTYEGETEIMLKSLDKIVGSQFAGQTAILSDETKDEVEIPEVAEESEEVEPAEQEAEETPEEPNEPAELSL